MISIIKVEPEIAKHAIQVTTNSEEVTRNSTHQPIQTYVPRLMVL